MNKEEVKEHFEERAGILEFMGMYPRREAERLARLETEAWLKAHPKEKVEA
jgi:hypothetical protein